MSFYIKTFIFLLIFVHDRLYRKNNKTNIVMLHHCFMCVCYVDFRALGYETLLYIQNVLVAAGLDTVDC